MNQIRIAVGQINSIVGDIRGNCDKILSHAKKAEAAGADIVSFPELAVTGYPPEDLLLKPKFIRDNLDAISLLKKEIGNIIAVVGFAENRGKTLYNAAAILHKGREIAVYRKIKLPDYGVFDEKRYFKAGRNAAVFSFSGISFGVNICEDIRRAGGPVKEQSHAGAKLIININSSPYQRGKTKEREEAVRKQCLRNRVFICYTNMTGGQDELVFDGNSFIMDPEGNVTHRATPFAEELLIADIFLENAVEKRTATISIPHKTASNKSPVPIGKSVKLCDEEEVYLALMTGLKDYALKNGFSKALLGLSGGIDSSIVAAIAADALGSENVTGVFMPSRYSSGESREDAAELAENLHIRFMDIPIEEIFKASLETLSSAFAGRKHDLTEENLQVRIRGNILMALSNKFGYLVLTTGNKSEMSVGYSTLYGDMAGGFSVIKDVYKTLVYKISLWRNSKSNVIPLRVFTKAPTAELRPNQKDQDTLPPYDILDGILKEYIDKNCGYEQIITLGYDEETVRKVMDMVDRSEYKRRQAPPGVKITPRAFGRDRRMPLTNRYRI